VLTAHDGESALREFEAHQDQIELLFLDVIMPGGNGKEVFQEVRRTHTTPVLFTSGYSASSLSEEFLNEHDVEILPKPFSPEALLRRVRDHLDR
jgi:DNA-binding response OmpR family regulator